MTTPKKQDGDGSESHPYRDVIGRRALPHDPPLYVDSASEVFFITICCETRRENQLCLPPPWQTIVGATRFYEARKDWFVHLLVAMPNHLHALVSFAMDTPMRKLIANWKRYTSGRAKIGWQRDFFDHRLRSDESWREKADYILANPVRAGLVNDWRDWPYVLFPEQSNR